MISAVPQVAVSVVVPTRGRPQALGRCLDALLAQKYPSYEVIVVDDGPDLATRSAVTRRAAAAARRGCALRYLRTAGGQGPAAARNIGWRAAAGAILAFTDDDCIPDPWWLSEGMRAFVPGVAGVQGRIVVPLRPHPTDYERNAAGLEEAEFATANCLYRREVLAAVGGFDERFTTSWREDSDLFLTLLEQGQNLVKAPGAVIVHPVRPARWGGSLLQQPKSLFNALLYKKHPALYRQRIQPAPPWSYYATTAVLLVALSGALFGRRRLALGAGCLWMCLTGRFCLRRLQGTSRAAAHVSEMIATSALIPPFTVFWRLRGAIRFRVIFL